MKKPRVRCPVCQRYIAVYVVGNGEQRMAQHMNKREKDRIKCAGEKKWRA